MKIPTTLPVTAEQSRAARFQLGLTQANVIEESSLPGHKLKNFETGRFVPDMPFLENLRDYYASKGIDFNETAAAAAPTPAQEVVSPPGGAIVRPIHRQAFYVSDALSPEIVNQVLERMDQNDERIAGLLLSPAKSGLLTEYSDETEAAVRELFGALAENHLAFRLLQGRNIVTPPKKDKEAVTIADIVGKFFASSPLASVTVPALGSKEKPVLDSTETDSEGGEE